MKTTDISEAKASSSHLIKTIQETDKPIVISKSGKPDVVLTVYKENNSPRKLGGSWKGKVKIKDCFDDIDEEIGDLFYHSSVFPDITHEYPA